tara:strand:+ start:28257 stop:29483 length:1227 start_codon:yes stop_codon:yes gene_type:complete
MKLYASLLLSIGLIFSNAQSNIQYDSLDFGSFSVGFSDTLLLEETIPYKYKNYAGSSPILIKIWHPIPKNESSNFLSAQAFQYSRNLDTNVQELEAELISKFEEYYDRNILRQDYIHFDEIEYPVLGSELLLDYIKKTPTKSREAKLDKDSNFPILIYHHGSRGTAFDNYIMAEYLASHGYIVIAGNFNLAYENRPYGYTKNDPYDKRFCERIIEFAQDLNSNTPIGFIGHSWGAQMGFSLLADEKNISAFVSMETTLELWNRKQVKAKWPRLSGKIMENYADYNLPILMFANQGPEMPVQFDFFKPIQSPQLIFATCKEEFVHESYASYYSARLNYSQTFPQNDAEEFKKQIGYFHNNLKLILNFMDENLKGQKVDYTSFEKDFYLKIKNGKSPEEDSKPAILNSPN